MSPSFTHTISGTAKIILTGGTWSGDNNVGNSIDIAGNITISGAVQKTGGTLTYISGTVVTTGSTLSVTQGGTTTLNTNGITWNNFTLSSNLQTIILTSNLVVGGLLSTSSIQTINSTTSETITVFGGLNYTNWLLGNTKIILKGGSVSSSVNGQIALNLDIDGNVSFVGVVNIRGIILNYVSGTVTTSGSTLNFLYYYTSTLNTNGIVWDNISIGLSVIILTSNLTCGGVLTIQGGATTFNTSNSSTATLSGGLTMNSTLGGTAKLILTGGTWSGNNGVSNNLDIAGNVTVSGTVLKSGGTLTYVSGTVTVTGSTINFQNACTVSTGGMVWNNLGNSSSTTVTITSNLFIGGSFTTSGGTSPTIVFNNTSSNVIFVSGGMSIGGAVTGTAPIYFTGGTWTASTYLSLNLFIQGNVTVSGVVQFQSATITYLSGTVTTIGSTLNLRNSTNLNTNGMTWNNVTCDTATQTMTLLSNFSAGGVFTVTNVLTINTSVSATLIVFGQLAVNNNISGTAKIVLTGGSWTGNVTNRINNNLDINGNVTVSGSVSYGTGTITYVSGTLTSTGSTLNIQTSCTLNTSGMAWNNIITVASNPTITLTSNLLLNGTFTNQVNTTINRTTAETITTNGLSLQNQLQGTADFYIIGGSISSASGVYSMTMNIYINGNVSIIGAQQFNLTNRLFSYISGTVNVTISSVGFSSCTLNTSGITWSNVTLGGTTTLTSSITIGGALNAGASMVINKTTNETVSANGLTINNAGSGTADIYLTGGTWSGNNGFSNNLFINGNATISGGVQKSGGTITYVSGTVTVAGSTLVITGSCTLNTSGMAWDGFNTNVSVKTITLTSNLLINGVFSTSTTGTTTFNKTTTETVTCAGGMNGFNVNSVIAGTADFYLTGGTWGPNYFVVYVNVFINGNCTISYAVFGLKTLTYLSGSVTCTGTFLPFNCTLDTQGINWNAIEITNPGTILLKSNLNIDGVFRLWYTHNFTRLSNQVINCNGGLTGNPGGISYGFSIIPDLYINGGVFDNNGSFYSGSIYLNGNVTILNTIFLGSGGAFTPTSLIYLSGKPNVSSARLYVGVGINTLINMDKVPFRTVTLLQNITVTMNTFFAGTPSQPCSISTTGTPSAIAFQDGFEKIGKFVNLSGIFISRPNQLLIITNPRFNTNRSTNFGIRYYNQSPNGAPKGAPSIADTMTVPALGLVNDPCFQYS
jgi:hypothetical protein